MSSETNWAFWSVVFDCTINLAIPVACVFLIIASTVEESLFITDIFPPKVELPSAPRIKASSCQLPLYVLILIEVCPALWSSLTPSIQAKPLPTLELPWKVIPILLPSVVDVFCNLNNLLLAKLVPLTAPSVILILPLKVPPLAFDTKSVGILPVVA